MVGFLDSSGEAERWRILVGDDNVGEVSGGSFSKGRESFFDGDEVLVHGGVARGDG